MRFSVFAAAVVAALVGFGGTLAVILAAAAAVKADAAQTSSWVTALCLVMAATSAGLSLRHRIPIVTAWSTPGAALIAAGTDVASVNLAVGAFLLSAALVVLTAAVRPLAALFERIPVAIASAMLAGVLFKLVLLMLDGAAAAPALVLPLFVLFFTARLFSPTSAVLFVLAGGGLLAWLLGLTGPLATQATLSTLVLIRPEFEPATLIGLGLPLFLVTMASQNLPGFAVLRAAGYPVPARSILATTGLASAVSAIFGAHTSNLAAIIASLCTSPDAHPDPARRWLTGVLYGACYLVFAAFGSSLVGLFVAMPAALVTTVAGLALLGPLAGALGGAMANPADRLAAALTFAVSASSLSIGGIGSAFWGLLAGLAVLGLDGAFARLRGGGPRG